MRRRLRAPAKRTRSELCHTKSVHWQHGTSNLSCQCPATQSEGRCCDPACKLAVSPRSIKYHPTSPWVIAAAPQPRTRVPSEDHGLGDPKEVTGGQSSSPPPRLVGVAADQGHLHSSNSFPPSSSPGCSSLRPSSSLYWGGRGIDVTVGIGRSTRSDFPEPDHVMRPLLPLLVLMAGGASVVYSAAMAAAARVLESPLWAPPLAYAEALVIIAAFVSFFDKSPPLKSWRDAISDTYNFIRCRPWRRIPVLTGGILGSSIGFVVSFAPPVIGMGPFFVSFVTGQVLTALVMDQTGWFWAARAPAIKRVLAGNLLVVLGALIFQWPSFEAIEKTKWTRAAGSIGASLAAGMFAVMQGGFNCKLTRLLGADTRTTLWSLSSGLVILTVIAAILHPRPKFEHYLELNYPLDLWKLIGGFLALSGLLTTMVIPRFLGFALTTCWMVTGELIVSLVVDHFGLLELSRRRADAFRILGISMVLLGVVLIQTLKLLSAKQVENWNQASSDTHVALTSVEDWVHRDRD